MSGVMSYQHLLRAALVLTAAATVGAQAPAGTPPAGATAASGPKFEVASIKLNTNTGVASPSPISPGAGDYFRTGSSIRALINQAYQIPFVRQIGGPEWIREDTYIINAKMPDNLPRTPANLQAMIRALLADRFKLVMREEVREMPIYALVSARADGKLGPKLQLSNCPPREAGQPAVVPPNLAGLTWERGPKCGQISSARGFLVLGGHPIARLADMLQSSLDRPVVDRTGLTGDYVVEVTYAAQAGPDAEGASIFTAIQEQLGLKLESERSPMPVLVIDSIQRPNEN